VPLWLGGSYGTGRPIVLALCPTSADQQRCGFGAAASRSIGLRVRSVVQDHAGSMGGALPYSGASQG
jgi:hypothetical protein